MNDLYLSYVFFALTHRDDLTVYIAEAMWKWARKPAQGIIRLDIDRDWDVHSYQTQREWIDYHTQQIEKHYKLGKWVHMCGDWIDLYQ